MAEDNERINQLLARLDVLLKKQESFSKEISELRDEIYFLKSSFAGEKPHEIKKVLSDQPVNESYVEPITSTIQGDVQPEPEKKYSLPPEIPGIKPPSPPKKRSDTEKFIGENLISKIGIAITIIGVAIGAKYSIDHDLISPLTRIILGYLVGLGLLGFGYKLKTKYAEFSAVLVSGAIAILYFMTYAAYSFYAFIPQIIAFAMMVLFTVFAVAAALNYNRQIIAHIGLVGAYAVPFLLSNGVGNSLVLFTYMAIINIGILLISLRKYWKLLYYSSFILTWFIFLFWYMFQYNELKHFTLFWTFLFIFFTTFYLIFIAYKLIQHEKFRFQDIILILFNSFIFYGLGYSGLSKYFDGEQLLGLFTLSNAVIHICVGAVIYRQKLADQNLFFLVAGLALIFITITIPVQLDGHWVTLLWAGEAALLFWIGRTRGVTFYENIGFGLMLLAFSGIVFDWLTLYGHYNPIFTETKITPFLNIHFASSILFIFSFVFMYILNENKKYISASTSQRSFIPLFNFLIPVILLVTIYISIRLEISTYWDQLYADSALDLKQVGEEYSITYWNEDLLRFKTIWLLNYSLLFLSLLYLLNIKTFRDKSLATISLILSFGLVFAFLLVGSYDMSELRDSYLNQSPSDNFHPGKMNIIIRYLSYVFLALMIFSINKFIHRDPPRPKLNVPFELLLHTSILWIASSEFITLLTIMKSSQSTKLGLSILWGIYALLLIVLGIWKNKKYLRIAAISLFAVTLIKLIFYDLSHLNTIAKTIVFLSLGVLLLIISFLYNKNKHLTSAENIK